jgi:uncharacterized protein YdiU (UPF0061 family)
MALPPYLMTRSCRGTCGCRAAPGPGSRPGRAAWHELGWSLDNLGGVDAAAVWCGNRLPTDARPVAQAYAGHQFGGYSPQLGDGRALLLGERFDRSGRRRDIALKGSGRTPFSRGGDGKAAVGPMLREVLIGEAMHALGIPTTRALAVVATGETVWRDTALPGAVLTRVAASHLRVGTLQYFATRGDFDTLRLVVDYAIARHDPQLREAPDRVYALLRAVVQRQARLVAQWMNVGFIHGVMNTDNMTLSGETIDYGPCAFMEAYDTATVYSSIDHQGRYAYANQPAAALWNLARLAEALLPLVADAADEASVREAVERVTRALDDFQPTYAAERLRGQRQRLGLLSDAPSDDADDAALAADWLALMQAQAVDHTLGWRLLADAAVGRPQPLLALFHEPRDAIVWLERWQTRFARDDATRGTGPTARAAHMKQASPWIIARNHNVEHALSAATEKGDLQPFEQLLDALRHPWDENAEHAVYAQPATPEQAAGYRTYCGT